MDTRHTDNVKQKNATEIQMKGTCKYFLKCGHAREDSYTCINNGGMYCGTFRIMRTEERLKNAV